MTHILEKIVQYKKNEVGHSKKAIPISELEKKPNFNRNCNSFVDRVLRQNEPGFIAEFKRKSPSRSDINLQANLTEVVAGYKSGGASALSILTDQHFFGGQNDFVSEVRNAHQDMPILRKEFIIDEYQVIEAKALGSDIILLICEILSKEEVIRFAQLARSLGMEVLLEMHTADQIEKYNEHISIVGVNNRDLKSFEVDYERSKKLFDQLPGDALKITESGLSKVETCVMLYKHGFRGFLIGEQFMKQEDPGAACQHFISKFKEQMEQV